METKWDKGSVSTVVYTWLDEWLQGVSSMILTAGKKEVPRRQQRCAAANLHSKWNLCVFCFLGREEWNSEQSQYVKQRHSTGKETFFFFPGWTKEMGNWNWISVVTGHLEGIDVAHLHTPQKKGIHWAIIWLWFTDPSCFIGWKRRRVPSCFLGWKRRRLLRCAFSVAF